MEDDRAVIAGGGQLVDVLPGNALPVPEPRPYGGAHDTCKDTEGSFAHTFLLPGKTQAKCHLTDGPVFALPDDVTVRTLALPAADHSRRRLLGVVWLTLTLAVLAAAWGCRRTAPVLETDPTTQARLVVSGRIRGPARYRVELPLRDGEALVRQPGVIHVNRSDVDADADFVIGSGRASRPRPAYRVDDGLGSPVA